MIANALEVNLKGLTSYNQFVLYKVVPSKRRPGKFDKLPCDKNGYPIDAHDPQYWMSEDEALAALQFCLDMFGSNFGIGFTFTADDPFYFLDIDNAWNGKEWSQLSQLLCGALPGAAVEVSQSNTGLHIFGRYTGEEPAHGCKNEPLGLELYTSERFAALTGINATGDCNLDHTTELMAVIEGYFPASTNEPILQDLTSGPRENHVPIVDDDELIEKALASESAASRLGGRASFADLWNRNEEVLKACYPDEERDYDASKADSALASHLLFWTSGDGERTVRLMAKSALAIGREKKFARKDYLPRTVKRAYSANTGSFYSAKKVVEPVEVIEVPPELEFQELPDDWILTEVSTETGRNAEIMLDAYYNQRLYGRGKESFWWSGQRYQPVEEKQLKRSVSNTLVGTGQHKEAIVNGTANMLNIRAEEIPELNPPNAVAYFANGCIDFAGDHRNVMPHSQVNYNSYVLPFSYNPDAGVPFEFMKFLNSIFENDDDKSFKIDAIQEILGWALIGSTLGIERCVVLRGATRAGKGTILNVLTKITGQGSHSTVGALDELCDDKVKASLRDSNLVIDFDAKSVPPRHIDQTIGMINKLTSNEPTSIKYLYTQHSWTGPLNCKLYMACNALPTMIDDTGAIVGRLHQIMFNKSFLHNEDINLQERLDGELEAIGNWAVEGLERLVKNRRFTTPRSSIDAALEATETSQPLSMFTEECLVIGEHHDHRAHLDVLYARWCEWCEATGNKPRSMQYFSKQLADTLRSSGVEKRKQIRIDGRNKTGFAGVNIRTNHLTIVK